MSERTASAAVLRARGRRKEFGKGDALVRAVDEVDLEVARAETVAVMGPSGCGKSTLLHLLGGLERPTGGELVLAGSRLDKLGERGLARLRQGHRARCQAFVRAGPRARRDAPPAHCRAVGG